MAKEPMDGPHELRLENRARLSVNGVREVESFDEESVVLHTTKGRSGHPRAAAASADALYRRRTGRRRRDRGRNVL